MNLYPGKSPAWGLRLLLLACLSTPASAEVYRWTDSGGNVHFGDRPPSSGNAEPIAVKPVATESVYAPRDDAGHVRRQKEMADALHKEREEKAAAKVAEARERAEQARKCEVLAARLTFMKSVSRFYDIDAKGEQVFYSDEEGDRLRDDFSKRYQEACSK